jgi:hypothetical protein
MKVCSQPGCPTLTNTSRCPQHQRARHQARGSATQRGYGTAHRELRKQWAIRISTGAVNCRRCGQRIDRDAAWDLGHTDDRTGYLGPEHQRCNRSAGGAASHRNTPGGTPFNRRG